MEINIESNIEQIREDFERLLNWETKARAIIEKHLEQIEKDAKGFAPVDTGFLRENIRNMGTRIAGDIIEGSILSTAEYSTFVEEGTSRMGAQPFLRPALDKNIDGLIEELVQLFENLVKGDE